MNLSGRLATCPTLKVIATRNCWESKKSWADSRKRCVKPTEQKSFGSLQGAALATKRGRVRQKVYYVETWRTPPSAALLTLCGTVVVSRGGGAPSGIVFLAQGGVAQSSRLAFSPDHANRRDSATEDTENTEKASISDFGHGHVGRLANSA